MAGLKVTRSSSRKIPGKLILGRKEGTESRETAPVAAVSGSRIDIDFPIDAYHPQLTSSSREFAGDFSRGSELCLKRGKEEGRRGKAGFHWMLKF